MIRLVFPDPPFENLLKRAAGTTGSGKFDERNLALLVQEETACGQKSNFNKLVSRESVEGSDSGRRPSQRSKNGKSPIARTPAGGNADFNVGEGADVEEEFEMEATAVRGRATASAGRRQRAQRKSGGGGRTGMAFESGCREGRSALTAGRHRGGGREVLGAPERQKTCRTGSASAGKIEQGATPAAGGRLGA